ncbi:hypothetical protein KIH86_28025 [Paenibacillus sp. HN-1]|uniref:hypothetical protein n=1 Tax=Paenibacillus TaxID=44249 RepID=UPI001CA7C7B5|nr:MULTISPECIES: hypothetical protein [Paenibacillus]MBY9078796.1 hypothetical protein [Paenibacillus sp. CGMCC 1.18879]MBY9088044.1 hypothetical protein [Paenibacillus sinensis]
MSIEQQLVEEFKRDSENRRCPPGLDARIAAEYRQLVVKQRGERLMLRKGKTAKIIWIAVIVLVVCGFGYAGNELLFEDHKDRLAVNYQTDQQLHLEAADVEKIRSSLAEVKAKLAPGDTAVVYLKDYELKIQGSPVVFGINNPVSLKPDAWRAALKQHNIGEKLPESLPGMFKLAEGMEASPYRIIYGTDAYQLLDEMKAESQKTGSRVLWRKTELSADQPIVPYTSVYRNSSNDTIYVTWEVADGDTDVKLFQAAPPNTEYEDITINGVTAHYLMNDQALFGQSTIQQDVMWLKESGTQTIIYHVQSDSTTLTKEQLIQAAQSLLQ